MENIKFNPKGLHKYLEQSIKSEYILEKKFSLKQYNKIGFHGFMRRLFSTRIIINGREWFVCGFEDAQYKLEEQIMRVKLIIKSN